MGKKVRLKPSEHEPEVQLAQPLVEQAPGHLRAPVVDAGRRARGSSRRRARSGSAPPRSRCRSAAGRPGGEACMTPESPPMVNMRDEAEREAERAS